MKKLLGIAATLVLCVLPIAASAVDAGDQLALDATLQNRSDAPIAVIGFCNATATPADLEGYVGDNSDHLGLVSSLSGNARKSITLIVPAHWYYRVRINPSPADVSCKVTGWPLK